MNPNFLNHERRPLLFHHTTTRTTTSRNGDNPLRCNLCAITDLKNLQMSQIKESNTRASYCANAWTCARRATDHDLVDVIPDEK